MASPVLTNVNYRPSGADNGFQRFNLYHPITAPPANGWPVVVVLNLSTFDSTTAIGATISGWREELVRAGFAFVDAKVTPSGQGAGLGLFRDDGDASWGTDDTMEFDAMSIVQHLREEIALGGSTEYANLDASRIILWGEDAAAQVVAWIAFNKDLAVPMHADTQRQESSRVFAVVARHGPTWFPAFADATAQVKFRDSTTPAVAAATYGNAIEQDKIDASPISKLLLADALEANRILPVYLRSEKTQGVDDETLGADGTPTLDNESTLTTDADTWFVRILAKVLRSSFVSLYFHGRESRWITQPADSGLGNLEIGADFEKDDEDGVGGWSTERRFARAFLANHCGGRGVDTFDIPYEWDADSETIREGLRSDKAQGAVFRRQAASNASRDGEARVRRWSVGHRQATAADVARLRALLLATNGGEAIDFPMPDAPGSTLAAFVSDPTISRSNGAWYEWTAELAEAI